MNMEGLDLLEVSQKLKPQLESYLGTTIESGCDGCLFAESYSLDFSEVRDFIPEKYHRIFKENDWFSGASGTIEVLSLADEQMHEYTVMLLSQQSKPLIFAIQDEGGKYIVISDFIEGEVI